ncbi:MAG: hypothetical protein QXP68_04570 [Thermosphaera sp.]
MTGGTVVALDYDGVLVDSYFGIDDFYLKDLPELTGVGDVFGRYLLYMEYLSEGWGLLRIDWWPSVLNLSHDAMNELLIKYWERRIENTVVLPGSFKALESMRSKGFVVVHVGYMDDIPGLKSWRVEVDGFKPYFDEILIVGEDFESRDEALDYLLRKYNPSRLIYVDDKPINLFKIDLKLGKDPRLTLVRREFGKKWMFPWEDPVMKYPVVKNLYEVEKFVID